MSGREMKRYSRTAVTYRLGSAQLRRLDDAAKSIGKSKTQLVEEAIAMYLNQLHLSGVI